MSSALVTSTIFYLRDLHLSQWKELVYYNSCPFNDYFMAVLLLDTEFIKVLGALLGN